MTRLEDECIHHLVKSFLDILVLAKLNGTPMHGYSMIADLHNTYGVLLSPGTLYPLLYRLKEENLVEIEEVERRKVYSLTPLGKKRALQIFELYKKNIEKILLITKHNLSQTTIMKEIEVKTY